MRPRRADDLEEARRGEQDLATDVVAGLEMAATEGDVVRHQADLGFVDDAAALCGDATDSGQRQEQRQGCETTCQQT